VKKLLRMSVTMHFFTNRIIIDLSVLWNRLPWHGRISDSSLFAHFQEEIEVSGHCMAQRNEITKYTR